MRKVLLFIALLLLSQPALAGKRAFVLANAEYDELTDLGNTHADAEAYVQTFRDFGYQVSHHTDLSRRQTVQALDGFLNSVAPGDQVVFVYAGHGWSDGQVNYLVPTDAPRKASTRVLKRQSFALRNGVTGILDDLDSLGVSLTVAIIDACRDNPFAPLQGNRSVGLSRGLVRVSAPQGTFVIFSAGEGQQALDGLPDDPPGQKLSVFTRVFVPRLKSGVPLESAISSAQQEVAQLALRSNGHKQHPAYYDQTLGQTCLQGECLSALQTAAKPADDICEKLYQEAKSEKACFAYEAYARTCPDHIFSTLATSYLKHNCGDITTSALEPAPETTRNGSVQQLPDPAPETDDPAPDTTAAPLPEPEILHEEIESQLRLTRSDKREIQQRLNLLDFSAGAADGIFGNRTRAAISAWQAAQDNLVTGYLDEDQLDALNAQSQTAYDRFRAEQAARQKRARQRRSSTTTSKTVVKKPSQPKTQDSTTDAPFSVPYGNPSSDLHD